jgi:hypothetical protein
MNRTRLIAVLVSLASVFLASVTVCAFGVRAQTTISTGSITGTVTDQSGAAVGGAQITVTNKDNAQTLNLTTSSVGTYNSGGLVPGNYTVRVEAKGFKTEIVSVVVQVGVTFTQNVKLEVGSTNTVVEVTGAAVTINTEQPTIQGVLTEEQIQNLPIDGRNFLSLAQLEPGVQIQ